MKAVAIAAMLAVTTAAPAALGAEVPTPIAVSETASHLALFDRPGDTASFSVRLEAGRDYAFSGANNRGDFGDVRYEVRDNRGRKLAEFYSFDDTAGGTEFRSPGTGTVTITAKHVVTSDGDTPSGAFVSVRPDCRGTPATRCVAPINRLLKGKTLDWGGDVDASRVALTRGRTYVATVFGPPSGRTGNGFNKVAFRDLRGRVLSTCRIQGDNCVSQFRPTTSGTYLVAIDTDYEERGNPYSFRVDLR